MTKDEALDLALEALEYLMTNKTIHYTYRDKAEKAITAIKQARALDKKAENARELGLDYEPWESSDTAHRPGGLPQDFTKHEVESFDDWSEWVNPDSEQYFMKCCDCGLVHEMQFKVAKYAEGDACEFVEDADLQAVFRARRTTPHAAQLALVQEPDLIARLKHPEDHYEFTDPKKANAVLMSLCQEAADALAAPAAPVREPVAWRTFDGEGGYDYRTYDMNEDYAKEWNERNPNHKGWVEPLYTTPPAAPVQEPVAWLRDPKHYPAEDKIMPHVTWEKERLNTTPLYTAPPAHPAVPDAMTSADIQEHIEYVAGWNDCRQAMMEMMK
jgi:hypothetical protein